MRADLEVGNILDEMMIGKGAIIESLMMMIEI